MNLSTQILQHSISVKCDFIIDTEICYTLYFNGYTWINRSPKTTNIDK